MSHALLLKGDDGPDVRGGSGDILLVHATETDRKGKAAPTVLDCVPPKASHDCTVLSSLLGSTLDLMVPGKGRERPAPETLMLSKLLLGMSPLDAR